MSFLQNLVYDRLVNYEMVLVIVLIAIAFFSSIREERRWVIFGYMIIGILFTVVSVLKIFKEGSANDPSVTRSVIKAILSLLATTAWAVMLGKRTKEQELYEDEVNEENS